MKEGDEIDLGGRGFRAVEPVVRDMRTTWWGFETRDRVLFPGDGFAYSHYHEDGHCGLVAEEAASLDCRTRPRYLRISRCGGPSGPTCAITATGSTSS